MINTIINIFAVILSPVFAVWVGRVLQNRSEKRKDKMNVFRSIVSSRIYGWTVDSVNALNLIEIVFYKDKSVCNQWRKYYEALNVKPPISDEQNRKMLFEQNELIRVMGKSMNYSDDAIAQIIRTPYIPVAMSHQMQNQQQFQDMQMVAIQKLLNGLSDKQ